MLPRERWSDDRLDAFEKRVEERFDRVDERFDRIDERFKAADQRFEQIDKRLDRMEADIRELRVIMIGGFVTLLAAMIGMNAF